MPSASNGALSRWAIAGSATAPRINEDTVMPSWAVASMADTCSRPQMTVRARRSPASARGSIWLRRTEINANSPPTKK